VSGPALVSRADGWIAGPTRARLALAAIAALAAGSYAWRANREVLEVYYAAAVRSMSSNWHDFVFGGFDPAGTVTLDKLPGAFWLQALSVRTFGLHTWAIVLPQIAEGVVTVVVLYSVVRRQAGTAAGLLAAALLAISPATVALNRGNISDSLLILLLVLAADATARATESGRLRPLLLAGIWVGLAFQAKMLEAWAILPALAASYLLAAPGSTRGRTVRLAAAGAVSAAVSLSWMCFVALTPASDRPYVDGSSHDSIFAQVFSYNGFGRIDTPLAHLGGAGRRAAALLSAFSIRHGRGWDRLLSGAAGRDVAWLLPVALASVAALLWARRKRDRRDPLRAAVVLWGGWLLIFAVAFSAAERINAYYLAALSPPLAALTAVGAVTAWRAIGRSGVPTLQIAAAVAACSAGYALRLLPFHRIPDWLPVAVAALGAAALAGAAVALARGTRRTQHAAFATALAATVLAPAVASASLVVEGRGPFDTPFQPAGVTAVTQTLARAADHPPAALVVAFRRGGAGSRYPLATYTSLLAAPLIYATGDEVLPIGGFTGEYPPPTLAQLQKLIARNELHLIASPPTTDPRIRWIDAHCQRLPVAAVLPLTYCS
jgi:4-amino-4-deoxy-L-arabinose transferase-like glycosyltransferase